MPCRNEAWTQSDEEVCDLNMAGVILTPGHLYTIFVPFRPCQTVKQATQQLSVKIHDCRSLHDQIREVQLSCMASPSSSEPDSDTAQAHAQLCDQACT